MKALSKYFEFPLTATYNIIHDQKGNRVLDVRSWGYLTGRGGGLALDDEVARLIQDEWAAEIAEALNAAALLQKEQS
ncbi:MAG: hypothetical protein ACI9WC_003016 [Arenicella sp.]|jgi:hypothetical protein